MTKFTFLELTLLVGVLASTSYSPKFNLGYGCMFYIVVVETILSERHTEGKVHCVQAGFLINIKNEIGYYARGRPPQAVRRALRVEERTRPE